MSWHSRLHDAHNMPSTAAATPRRTNHQMLTRSLVRIQTEYVWVLRGQTATPQHLHRADAHTGSRPRATCMGGLQNDAPLCAGAYVRTSSSTDLPVTYTYSHSPSLRGLLGCSSSLTESSDSDTPYPARALEFHTGLGNDAPWEARTLDLEVNSPTL